MLWISLSAEHSSRVYIAEHGIRSRVAVFPDRKNAMVYRVKGVPMTIVHDDLGRITHVHPSIIGGPATAD